ncbi:solute carrier family 13 member 3 isoform X2 [Protopterus annectens]|uniref:solute carrier family 13 member 3 isoform X2 n=1 Tax=Protopterus annectens TaxID=7888 RepID=UPI001CFC14FD|nr:solute carrier family 13 member 3 isoform X2 [Protopterus annectens]
MSVAELVSTHTVMEKTVAFAKKIWCVKKQFVLLLTPLIFLPVLFFLPLKEGKCLYVVLLMAMYWCTEALPLAVTSLLPVVLFPFLGVLSSSKVCPQYCLDTNFLFLSGLIMASAIEEWNLHRRIALKILLITGVQPARLILGMMLTTAFLSMWLSNTASTAMMLPIVNALLLSLFGNKEASKEPGQLSEVTSDEPNQNKICSVSSEIQQLSLEETTFLNGRPDAANKKKEGEYQKRVWKGFLIAVPYAASIGGTATLTGTAPNLILIGQLKSVFPGCDVVNFGSWFLFACPLMLLFLILGWLWIALFHGCFTLRVRKKKVEEEAESRVKLVIQEDYKRLGPMQFAEGAVAFFFFMFAALLFTRDPKFVPGWSKFFEKGYVTDATTAVTIVTMLFFFPSQKPSFKWWFDFKAPNNPIKPLMSWKRTQETVPWNIILLLGGGFAMARGCEESGLSIWLGSRLQPLQNVPPPAAVLLITVVIAMFTEFASNTATIIIFLPVLAELAVRLQVNPLYLMIPGTVGCSYAFMLPVSTPPNSIAFSSGLLMVKDMTQDRFKCACSYQRCLAVPNFGRSTAQPSGREPKGDPEHDAVACQR